MAMLSLGGALHAPMSTATMPSMLLPLDATPLSPTVDTAPLPLVGEPPRHWNEVALPVPASYAWPRVEHFAFYDHTGHFPLAWSEVGKAGISVADRRASQEPPRDWLHVIGDVKDFLDVYPYPIGVQTNSVTCANTNLASRATWREKIRSGAMLDAAEEFLWVNHIGDRSAGEQPPTVLQTLIGAPTFTTNATSHFAAREKTWNLWLRDLPVVPEGRETPAHLRLARRGAARPEQRMLVRTETELQLARDFVAAWNIPFATPPSRPAAQPHPDYKRNRLAMQHNYTAFKATYAPTVSAAALGRPTALTHVIGVPIAWADGPVALVNLADDNLFAVPYRSEEKLEAHFGQLTEMLPCDSQPHLLCTTPVSGHYVCALPTSARPLTVLRTAAHAREAATDHAPIAWCDTEALQQHAQLLYIAIALAQTRASTPGSTLRAERVGAWDAPRPVVPHRASDAWERASAADDAAEAWREFLAVEQDRAAEVSAALTAAGPDAQPFAAIVVSAATYASELPPPAQGLPEYHDPRLLLAPSPQPPMPLCTDYLAEVPPQAVPPGYEHALIPMRGLVRRWTRLELAGKYNLQAAYDYDCMLLGEASDLRRPTFAAYGDGAFVALPFADGTGSFLANLIIWERTGRGYRPMDITAPIRDHKKREVLMRVIGATSDQELLYFCLHGVRWLKFDAPRQIRFGRNVESLAPRVAKVGHATSKLIRAGLYGAIKLIKAPPAGAALDLLDPDLDDFLAFIPCYDMGCGGQDKADNPDEARKTGNTSDPQPGKGAVTRESRAEDRHATPGTPVISFNDLTGPRKMTPNYTGPPPSFPDPEVKSRPRHLAAGAAYLSHVAYIADDYLVGIKDDFRWFFWQFYLHQSQLWLSVEHLWVPFEVEANGTTVTEWWFCGVIPYVMNMGTRPASKIACRFSEVFQAEWRSRMRSEVVPTWRARQKPAVLHALERRRDALGTNEADPFKGWLYTDDFTMFFVGAWLAAAGAALWRSIVNEANIWMSKKVGAGTVIDSHGGRFVLNAGYTCLTPSKRARGIASATTALSAGVTVDELVATNSFFVHVDDIINLEPGTLKGAWAPVKALAGGDTVVLSDERWPRPRAVYQRVVEQLQHKAAASFLCAVNDAYTIDPWSGCGLPFATSTSDACSAPAHGPPSVFGWLDGQYWHFPLTGEWAYRHITVTEALGYAGNVIIFGRSIGAMQHLVNGDATGGLAMLMGTTNTPDLRYMRERLERTQEWADVSHTLWAQHLAGSANVFADLGSRNEWETLARVAAAYNVRLVETPLPPAFLDYAQDVLANTSHYEPRDARERPRARQHRGDPFTPPDKYEYGVEAIEFMDHAPSTPPMLARVCTPDRARHTSQPTEATSTPTMLMPRVEPRVDQRDAPPPVTPTRSARADPATLTPPMLRQRTPPHARADACGRSPARARANATAQLDAAWRATQRTERRCQPRHEPHSPQPLTAQQARRAAALATANTLAQDATAYAICPGEPGRLKALCVGAAAARNAAIPSGTRGVDSWGFAWVVRFCTEHNTPWMRPHVVEPEWQQREAYLVALALLWISMHMAPSAQRRARGYDEAMPDSALNAIYGWRRVLRDCGRHLAPMALALAQCRGIRLQYTITWGNDSLVPQKHRPIPKALVLAILRVLTNYSVPGWTRQQHDMWRRLVKYELVTGTRGNEVAGEETRLSRNDFVPVLDGIIAEPTPANYGRMRKGDHLRGKSSPSKCDRTNACWGAKDMWFELDPDSELNFANDWVAFELSNPCPQPLRGSTPAFSPTEDTRPLTTALLHAQHKELLAAADPTAEHTFHDWRARLAQALVNAGCSDAVIQAALRWKSPQSIQAYAGLPPSEYATMVEAAAWRDAATPSTRRVPIYDPSEACAQMDNTIKALERDLGSKGARAAGATPATPPAPRAPPQTPTTQQRRKQPAPHTAAARSAAAQPPARTLPARATNAANNKRSATGKKRARGTTPTTARSTAGRVQCDPPTRPRPPTSKSRTPAPPQAPQSFDLGDLGTIEGDTASGHAALGATLALPALSKRSEDKKDRYEVLAWARSVNKYIVRTQDSHLHAVPVGTVDRQLHKLRHARAT